MGENIPKKHTFKKNNNINTSPIHTWLYLYCAYCMHICVELVLSSDQTVKVILKIQIFWQEGFTNIIIISIEYNDIQ